MKADFGVLVAGLAALGLGGSASAQTATPDPERGAEVFRAQCIACHSVDSAKSSPIGPHLLGVVGRKAASAEGFRYSEALQKVDLAWTPGNLDAWLANPWSIAPGTPKALLVPSAKNRADVIAYLQSVAPPGAP